MPRDCIRTARALMVGDHYGLDRCFHSDILHRAGEPSRECLEPRLSVAFTFVPR